eukprot:m.210817 g.210817  ORF g.210817 m.210817 type:complete len:85 (+) comp39746_c0_seq1:186-440(+)
MTGLDLEMGVMEMSTGDHENEVDNMLSDNELDYSTDSDGISPSTSTSPTSASHSSSEWTGSSEEEDFDSEWDDDASVCITCPVS